MNVSETGLDLIRAHEGLKLVAYLDSVGVPTIGYGHTRGVKIGDHCTKDQAETWLHGDVTYAEQCVNGAVTVPLTQGEFDALVSFVFNLGCLAFKNSTLLRKLNDSDYDGAALEFGRWNHAGGQVLAGLTARREDERKRFETLA